MQLFEALSDIHLIHTNMKEASHVLIKEETKIEKQAYEDHA